MDKVKGRYTTVMLSHEAKAEIDQMIGDTRRPHGSFILEAMRIREFIKNNGGLDKVLVAIQHIQVKDTLDTVLKKHA